MLKYLRYRYAKTKMVAYVNGELSDKTRRFIGRLINEDERVYNEYIRQRQTRQNLERQLPILGRPSETKLDAIWANIQTELATPSPTPEPSRVSQKPFSLTYGVAMVICVLVFLLPFALSVTGEKSPVNHRLIPATNEFTTPETPIPPAPATSVALVSSSAETIITEETSTNLQNTPAPNTPGQ